MQSMSNLAHALFVILLINVTLVLKYFKESGYI